MSDRKPVFRQTGSSALYFLDTDEAAPGPSAAFLSSAGAPRPVLEVEEAWSDAAGIYIFLTEPPSDIEAFIRRIRELVRGQGYYNTRFLWVRNPSPASGLRAANRLCASRKTEGTGGWSVLRTEAFGFADYTLSLGARCAIKGPDAGNGYGFTFEPASPADPNIVFYSPLSAFPMSSPAMLLPLSGNTPGCFSLSLKLTNPGGGAAPSDFELLQAYSALFIPDPGQIPEGAVRTLKYPVLRQPESELITLYGSFDPLEHLGGRTFLSLIGPPGQAPAPPQIESYFITPTGRAVGLTPLRGLNGEADARFVFARRPLWTDPLAAPSYYLTLEGAFSAGAAAGRPREASAPALQERIVCGISSVEYAGLTAASGSALHFVPGGSAYAPGFSKSGAGTGNGSPPLLLTDLGTTSWVYITPPSAQERIYYYAQPEQALLYNAAGVTDRNGGSAGHLDFLETPAAVLPANPAPAAAFPMMPFRGIDPADAEYCRNIEYRAVAPLRRKIIADAADPVYGSGSAAGTEGNGETTGITPQGMIVVMGESPAEWKRLVLGNTDASQSQQGDDARLSVGSAWLQLSYVGGPLRAALQSSQLFLVAADPEVFRSACSVRYRLTEDSFVRLMRLPAEKRGPDDAAAAITRKSLEAQYPYYDDLAAYRTQLTAWAPGIEPYFAAWEAEGACFELAISGWKFLLSPYHWFSEDRERHRNTIMLIKFNRRALDELIEDTAGWPWPEAAGINGSLQSTRDELRSVFDAAKESVALAGESGSESPYKNFVENVVTNPDWNGVLFINCRVPPDRLPDQLRSISAGIDESKFYAHHLGLGVTPLSVQGQEVRLGSTSSFGLISYEDADDLVFSENTEFDFKVLSLIILFENSCIKSFSCRVELLICKLFGSSALLADGGRGNNLILDGAWQTDGGRDFYSFRQFGANRYRLENSALTAVEILSSRYTTLTAENAQPQQDEGLTGRFSLDGNLLFEELEGFDLFSFGPAKDRSGLSADGYLRFSGFIVDMTSDAAADPGRKKAFATKASQMAFEPSLSRSRENGLYGRFPLTLAGLLEAPAVPAESGPPGGVSPGEMGYSSVGVPLQQGELTYPWYGLVMDLDLGTLGSLADNPALKISLLAAWCKSDSPDSPIVYAGMRFPELGDLGVKLPIEGILSLGFRNIQFLSNDTGKGRMYMLRLRQFGIRLLGLSFPPGNNDIYLFGNPDNSPNSKLGWYAAYSGGKADKAARTRRFPPEGRIRRGGGV